MKISINLANKENPLERYLLAWALPLIAVGVAVLLLTLISAMQSFVELRKVQQASRQMQSELTLLRDRQLKAHRALEEPPTLSLYRETAFVNKLIDQKQLSLSRITIRAVELLPPGTRLASLSISQQAKHPSVSMSVQGLDVESLYNFLDQVEQAPDFSGVVVTSQSFTPQPGKEHPVALTCTATYIPDTVKKAARYGN